MEVEKYELTNPQKSIYLLENFYSGTNVNDICGSAIMRVEINFEVLEKAINLVIKNNPGFNLKFVQEDDTVKQFLGEYTYENIEIIDIQKEEDIAQIEELVFKDKFNIFKSEHLYKFKIFRFPNNYGGFLLNIHHIISDSWTLGLISRSIIDTYLKLIKNKEEKIYSEEFESNNFSYINYCISEKEYINSEKFQKDKLYWMNIFSTIPEVASIPSKSKSLYDTTTCEATRKTFIIPVDEVNVIKEYCKNNKVSMYNFFMAMYSLYISRVSGLKDFIMGTPVLNRANFSEKNTVGMFVSTVPLRFNFENINNFNELLTDISNKSMSMIRHQKYSYEYLINELRKNNSNIPNLYNILLSYQITRATVDEIDCNTKWAFNNYCPDELQIHLLDLNHIGSLQISYDYKNNKFSPEEIISIHTRIMHMINQVLKNSEIELKNIEIITEEEKNKILNDFNNTKFEYDKTKTIFELFEKQVNKTPDKIAVVFENEKLTYKQLNEKSNQLANYLLKNNAKQQDIIAVVLNRSLDLIVSLLAIIKIGCTYLPIDPDYPEDRINYMLKESNAKFVLTNLNTNKLIENYITNNIILDNIKNSELLKCSNKNLNIKVDAEVPMYLLYTSGSTGKPKGVIVTVKNVHNFIHGINNKIKLNENKVMVSVTTICFDIFGLELWCSLLNGMKLVLANEYEQNNAKLLNQLCLKNNVNIIQTTPSRFNMILNSENSMEFLKNMEDIILAGESLPSSMVEKLRNITNANIFNMYGPTETTIGSTMKKIEKNNRISIGTPLLNTQCYILDNNLNLLPSYAIGNLYISGDGVSKGYFHKEDLTNEKFIRCPYDNKKIIYNTNDLAYYTDDGEIIHLGRSDSQIKYKGYRIELGEIENVILKYKNILYVAVVFKNDKLYAFYSKKENSIVDINELRKYILNSLPAYMLPSVFFEVEKMPFTSNGKIDRKSLKIIEKKNNENKILPSNELENIIYNLVSKLSKNNNFGMEENFYAIGLDSISIISLAIEISEIFKVTINSRDIIKCSSIKDLSNIIKDKIDENSNEKILNNKLMKINEKNEYYELSSAQKRIYYSSEMSENKLLYNVSGGILVNKILNEKIIKDVFNELIKNNSSFRTYFKIINGVPKQFIIDNCKINILTKNIETKKIQKVVDDFPKPFNLENAPLLRVEINYINKNKTLILIDSHHIILDGTSLNILINEFCELYNEKINNKKIEKIEKFDYTDFSIYENKYLNSTEINNMKIYWENKFKNIEIPVINLPYDFSISQNKTFNGKKINTKISKKQFENILEISKKLEVSPYILCLSAFYILLYKYTGQNDFIVVSPTAGRDFIGTENIIGMFVNNIPLYANIDSNLKFDEFLNMLKTSVLEGLENGNYPYDKLIKDLKLKSNIALSDVMFIYQNENTKLPKIENTNLKVLLSNTNTSKFNLSLEIVPNMHIINLEYNTDLFKGETVVRILNSYINILNNILDNYNKKISEINCMCEKEKNKIIYDFNNTDLKYNEKITISKMFEEQVLKTPDKVALIFENKSLTFKELNEKANQLAYKIRNKNIKNNDVIGIITNRSLELIISILAVLKSGACYIPIDPNFPKDRVEYMLENSKSKLILTSENINNKVNFENKIIVDLNNENIYSGEKNNLAGINLLDDNSYIIYTSGSTGKPKGVVLKQKSLTNLANYLNNNLEFFKNNKNIVMCSITTASFDIFLFETILSMQAGITVVLANEDEQKIPSKLNELLIKNKVNSIQMTPSRMQFFIDNIEDVSAIKNIKYLTLAGEPLSENLLKSLIELGIKKVYNGYGPSETTVFSTFTDVTKKKVVTIGKGIANTQLYILDKDLNPCPIGVVGELYISGDGVGNGYLNNPELTSKSYIRNPFLKNKLMYRVGDLCKFNKNGEVICLGRVDNQIKIRGLRIELGEIENKILEFPFIEKCVVVKQVEKNREFISAYYISSKRIKKSELRAFLLETLPSYMVPSYFTAMSEFPQTPNGKINKKELPLPKIVKNKNENYVAPKTELEIKLVNIFEKILSISPIGINDNFFELGGDSILAMTLNIELLKITNKITYSDIFNNPTVNSLINFINSNKKEEKYELGFDNTKYVDILNNSIKIPEKLEKQENISVLLTGVTGFLGIHILESCIKNNFERIYCIIRNEPGISAEKKLKNKLHYYFNNKYDDIINKKIFIIEGDISEDNLGIEANNYEKLKNNVDIIINSAAKVTHFGNYEEFYKINVIGTQNLLDFCRKNNKKFYQISTLSVSGNSFVDSYTNIQTDMENKQFSENCFNIGQTLNNVYVRTKYEAEKYVFDSILNNTNSYIIRVGNLMPRFSDGVFQENLKENAYLNRLSAFIKLKNIPESIINTYLEFTPVDYCAEAIIKIIMYSNNENRIFHLFNHNHIYLKDLLKIIEKMNYKINVINNNEFKKYIKNIINDDNKKYIISELANDFSNDMNLNYESNIKIDSDFTIKYLKLLDFNWPIININYIEYILKIINRK